MIKKTISYTDYNGNECKEDYYFNLTEAEIIELETSVEGGLSELLMNIVKSNNSKEIMAKFKEIILYAYGEKSADGKRFVKFDRDGYRLANDFAQTEAFSKLYIELAFDADKAAEWINGIMPKQLNLSDAAEQTLMPAA